MSEEFLHFIWQHKLYSHKDLFTPEGQKIEIINPGEYNSNAGPDFFNAKIKIGNTLWAGNVEVHLDEDDWKNHGHHMDKAYDNVILHVVDRLSTKAKRTNGEIIPTLKINYNSLVQEEYQNLRLSKSWLACADKLNSINSFELTMWFERMLIERLENKSKDIEAVLKQTANNWDETFYRMLFRSFGFGVNGQPFELLAQSIPLTVLLKYADNINLVEALLYGQAGFLESVKDEYLIQLKKDYEFLKQKHQLKPIDNFLWKFLRLRPSNFPTIRLSQLSVLLVSLKGRFGEVLNTEGLDQVKQHLNVETSVYWENHYLPDKSTVKKKKFLGEKSQNVIIINTIIPMLFSFGKICGNEDVKNKALAWLSLLDPENNNLINEWKSRKISVKNAGDSQALIYLSKNYCKSKKCLHCRIGHKVLTVNFSK